MIILHPDQPSDLQADLQADLSAEPAQGFRPWKLRADLEELEQIIRNRKLFIADMFIERFQKIECSKYIMPFAKINGFVKKLCMLALSGIFVILALFLMKYSNLFL